MVGPSTGGPNLRTGPLPLQARKQLRGAPALEAQTNPLAPFLCRPDNTMVGPITGGPPNQHTGPFPLQAENNYGGPHYWRPPKSTHWPPSSAGLKSSYWPLSSAGRNQPGLAPLCRPKIKYHWPHSAGRNKLLLAPLCRPKSTTGGPTLQAGNNLLLSQQGHGNTTIYPNRTSMPAILPPAPLQWWPPQ